MSTPAAARKQRSRERDAAGLACVTVETNIAELEALLAEAGCLHPMTEVTRASLAAGLEALLRLLYAARDNMPGESVLQ